MRISNQLQNVRLLLGRRRRGTIDENREMESLPACYGEGSTLPKNATYLRKNVIALPNLWKVRLTFTAKKEALWHLGFNQVAGG